LERPVRIGISSCLLGEAVRFDGGHKRDAFLADTFGRFVEWVPVCPEVECGMGTPREPMHLVRTSAGIRLMTVETNLDLTPQMDSYAERRVERLRSEGLSGYVLKKDSPSCGLERVKVYNGRRVPAKSGRGLFAAKLVEWLPNLPIAEEGRLSDPRVRENFVERVFAYWRLQGLFSGRWTPRALVEFHTAHKLVLMAHSPRAYRALGRLVAKAGSMSRGELERSYTNGFMSALSVIATRARHASVLQHMARYFNGSLDLDARSELSTAIADYRRGVVPLMAPIILMRHYVRSQHVSSLAGQVYLDPHPQELMLRDHV
jgi:uncharacterized protein YbgA (DUF1722 family)/uncharacterized protein YbbK (DUF523 family)